MTPFLLCWELLLVLLNGLAPRHLGGWGGGFHTRNTPHLKDSLFLSYIFNLINISRSIFPQVLSKTSRIILRSLLSNLYWWEFIRNFWWSNKEQLEEYISLLWSKFYSFIYSRKKQATKLYQLEEVLQKIGAKSVFWTLRSNIYAKRWRWEVTRPTKSSDMTITPIA